MVRSSARVCLGTSLLQVPVAAVALDRLAMSWSARVPLVIVAFLSVVQAATAVPRSLRRWSRHSPAGASSAAVTSVGLLLGSSLVLYLRPAAPAGAALIVALGAASWLILIAWRPQPRVLAMGGPEFAERIYEVALRTGRAIARHPEGIDVIRFAVVSTLDEVDIDCDELVVDGRELSSFHQVPRDLRRDVERVLLAEAKGTDQEKQVRNDPSVFRSPVPLGGRFLKRCIDLTVASLALVLSAPILAAAIIAVRAEGAGPTVLRRPSVGIDGRPFDVFKLRTMRAGDRTSDERVHTLARGFRGRRGVSFGVPRYPQNTRVGRVLRRLSIDELPQFLNVLLGEMSIVGPRPLHLCELETLTPQTWMRLRVKPGMTGLWQVSGRSRLGESAMFDLDARYVQRWSFPLEMLILVRTPFAVFTCRGAA